MADSLEGAIERLLEAIGFELVALEKGGGHRRPLLRLRIDRPDGEPGRSSLTADDCGRASRKVMELLEERSDAPSDFILEVSSPGIERPLVRERDYMRFVGQPVRIRGYAALIEGRKQIDAVLAGYDRDEEAVLLDLDGERVAVPLSAVAKAHLRYQFDDGK